MRKWLVLLFLLAQPAQAQSYGCCGFKDWATYGSGNPFRYHPTADFMGGVGMDLVARGPWFAESVRDKWWKRLVIVGIGAAFWQYQNKKEIPGYRWDYVVYDWTWTVASAGIFELVLERIK